MNANELRLGLPSIDSQHMRLFDLLAQLQAEGSGQNLGAIYKNLEEYADEHFSFEEQCLRDARYPYLQEHRKEHEFFINNLHILKIKLQKGQTDLLRETAHFLTDWLAIHIGRSDRRYVPWLED